MLVIGINTLLADLPGGFQWPVGCSVRSAQAGEVKVKSKVRAFFWGNFMEFSEDSVKMPMTVRFNWLPGSDCNFTYPF